MKAKLACLVAVLVLSASALRADSDKTSWSVTTSVQNKYLNLAGVDLSDGRPTITTAIQGTQGDRFFGFWGSTGMSAAGPHASASANEYHLFAGLNHEFGPVRYTASAAYFAFANLRRSDDDIYVLDQRISWFEAPFVQPYVMIRAFNQVTHSSPGPGWFGWVGLQHTEKIRNQGFNLDLSAGYSDGPMNRPSGPVFCRITCSTSIKLDDEFKLTPAILFQVPIGSQRHEPRAFTRSNQTVASLALTWTPR